MKNALQHIIISSAWFDCIDNKPSKYSKIDYDGLNVYFNLFKFRVANQESNYTFYTCLSMLRKATKYTSEHIIECLKKLKQNKIIKMKNLSRWDYLYDENGKCDDNKFLAIEAIDVPNTQLDDEDEVIDNWITVDLDFLECHYEKVGLNEKFYPIYCLMRKLSCNTERKCFMSIEKMSEIINLDKDTINRMINKMNRVKVLYSRKIDNKKSSTRFEHYICFGYKSIDSFNRAFYHS